MSDTPDRGTNGEDAQQRSAAASLAEEQERYGILDEDRPTQKEDE